jgi:hypothetical protein
MLLTTRCWYPPPPHLPECMSQYVGSCVGGLDLFSISLRIFSNFRFSKFPPKFFQDNYSVTYNRKPLDFTKGDLVYFVGYEGPADHTRLGIVYDIKIRQSHFPLYEIYWFKDKLHSTHTAAHIDLVYTHDMIDSEIHPRSYLHIKDRVNDRGEGD